MRAQIDAIMKYLFSVSKETIILMLNTLFNENFDPDSVSITQSNSEFIDENFDVIRGDLFFQINVQNFDKTKSYNFHIEAQTQADGFMTIRLLNYGIKKADELQRLSGESKNFGKVRYVFPKAVVIHVEYGASIPKEYYEIEIVDIKDNGSEEIIHRVVPVVRYWELSDEEIIEKKLYPLLPLRIFLLRDKIKKFADSNLEDKKKVVSEIKGLAEKITLETRKLVIENKIKSEDAGKILTSLNKLIAYLNKLYNFDKNLNREVNKVIKNIFDELKEEGIEKQASETAKKMILKNEPLEKIVEYSELPEKKIQAIAKKLSRELVTN